MPGNETRTEPLTTVLANGTVPNLHTGYPETADTGQKPGKLVFKSSTLGENATTLCTQYYGSDLDGVSEIFIIEIPRSNVCFAKSYDKDTAFPVSGAGSVYEMHRIEIGDEFWVESGAINCDGSDLLCCAASGLVELVGASGTADKFNVHLFRPLATYVSATRELVRYVGMGSMDAS